MIFIVFICLTRPPYKRDCVNFRHRASMVIRHNIPQVNNSIYSHDTSARVKHYQHVPRRHWPYLKPPMITKQGTSHWFPEACFCFSISTPRACYKTLYHCRRILTIGCSFTTRGIDWSQFISMCPTNCPVRYSLKDITINLRYYICWSLSRKYLTSIFESER